jgi:hypothetical protein
MMKVVSGVFALGMLLLAGCGGTEEEREEVCYSPQQNISRAYEAGVLGCACDKERDEAVCVSDTVNNRKVALVCTSARWETVEDGPCMPPLP